jgi:hypothetical protein
LLIRILAGWIVDEEWQKPQQIEESYRFAAEITVATVTRDALCLSVGGHSPVKNH